MIDNEPKTRGPLLSSSITLLSRSIERHPTPPTLYHLALCLSRAIPERDLDKAIELCRRAVELDSNEIRYWHLLALLLAKQGEWMKAKGVIDAAIEIASDVETRLQAEDLSINGVNCQDFGGSDDEMTPGARGVEKSENEVAFTPLIGRDTKALPPASTLLRQLPDHPPPSHRGPCAQQSR